MDQCGALCHHRTTWVECGGFEHTGLAGCGDPVLLTLLVSAFHFGGGAREHDGIQAFRCVIVEQRDALVAEVYLHSIVG